MSVTLDGGTHHVGHAREKAGSVIDRGGAHYRKVDLAAQPHSLRVEVVEDLDMIGDEADRGENRRRETASPSVAKVVADVGFEPGIAGSAAAALIHQRPVRAFEHVGHGRARFAEFGFVPATTCDRLRDAVGREHDSGARP